MQELILNYPEDRKVEMLTKDLEFCRKAKIKNDKRELNGTFHKVINGSKQYHIFVEFGKDVKETIDKHLESLHYTGNINYIKKLKFGNHDNRRRLKKNRLHK